jgi:alpha-L-fucosidase 2
MIRSSHDPTDAKIRNTVKQDKTSIIMRKSTFSGIICGLAPAFLVVFFSGCRSGHDPGKQNERSLRGYNVVWDSLSRDHNGSMPIGNGDIGLNAWVEDDGDICFYIGKTDAWGDNGRLLKIGKVRVSCEPAIVFPGSSFTQELDLPSGTIRILSTGEINGRQATFSLSLWVDANHPVIHIRQASSVPVAMTASIELWRTAPCALPELAVSDLLEDRSRPGSLHEPVVVEPDRFIQSAGNQIGWFHHNQKSVGFEMTNKIQGLSEFLPRDPILHRTFGAIITGTDAERLSEKSLKTPSSKRGRLNVYILTKQPATPDEWLKAIEEIADETEKIPFKERLNAHENWWDEFWNRSWIHATLAVASRGNAEDGAFVVSRAYALQRFIDASAGRGRYPIKFNGSIFTVPARGNPGGADYRRWGPGYWWQNTRLPYQSMCASGDYDLMQPFFRMYAEEIYGLSRKRTKKYFGIDGVYFPECMYFWGSVFTSTYGWTPYEERTDKLQESGWHKWEWVSGPELVFMMLDYFDHTQDEEFLHERVIPVANDIMRFFENRYSTNQHGQLVMHPSMACETWWDCTNPMPELAGLHSISRRLLALPSSLTAATDRDFWKTFRAKLADLPVRETPSGTALAPAARFEDKRNVENPELYAVFPFRMFGLGQPDIELAKNALVHRWDSGDFGWRQDDVFMAYLGLTEQARDYVVHRSVNYDKRQRFPAFWGPNYDWTPDQDHGGILMKALQSMLMQADPYSGKIYLFPAWPNEWDVEFKLHAPFNTTIEGQFLNGEVEKLNVIPSSRKEDVIIMCKTAKSD